MKSKLKKVTFVLIVDGTLMIIVIIVLLKMEELQLLKIAFYMQLVEKIV